MSGNFAVARPLQPLGSFGTLTSTSAPEPAEIRAEAARCGLVSTYINARGSEVAVADRTLRALVAALAPGGTPVSAGRGLLPRTIVVRGGSRSVALPKEIRRPASWTLTAGERRFAGIVEESRLAFPDELSYGVYVLTIANAETDAPERSLLIIAPESTHQGPPALRVWLLAVQLYAIRSRTNWGHGDFTDLLALLDLAAHLGAAGVGINPLHALMNDGEEKVSPYSPSSRHFLNFLYIDVEALPEFDSAEAGDLASRISAMRDSDRIDYVGVAALKDEALRRCYDRFCASGAADADLIAFRAERGETLRRFSIFEAKRRRHGAPWVAWPQEDDAVDEREIEYHEYVQWRADRQLRACRDRAIELGLPIGLYIDLAVGVRPDGADAWIEQADYLPNVSIGAPPDLLNVNGQDWGLTAYQPQALERHAFEPFRRMLAASMRYAGALRLDHVLWLNRLYLIPRDMPPTEGCYLQYPLEALLAVLAIASEENRCIVIGEDLGTVPAELRTALRRWGVWTYHVMQFERDEDGRFRSANEYHDRALATFGTHDLAPFAAWVTGSDLAAKRQIGIDPGETEQERYQAVESLSAVVKASETERRTPAFLDIAEFLGAGPSRLVVVALEDALELQQLTNVPGTTAQHPNWRLRMPVPVEELAKDERLTRLGSVMAASGRATQKEKGRPGS